MSSSSSSDRAARIPWHNILMQGLLALTALPVVWVLLYPFIKQAPPTSLPVAQVPLPVKETPKQINVVEKAEKYLRKSKKEPLSGSLADILRSVEGKTEPSQSHQLLHQKAPSFSATRSDGQVWHMSDHFGKKPIILIFYLGYECNHCVSQLFDVQEDLSYFQQLGVEVVAISPDSPAHTRKRYETYGPFKFDVLSDYEKRVAAAYRVFVESKPDEAGDLYHATFVIDQHGMIRWANQDVEPFCGNTTLLYEVAKVLGKVPQQPNKPDVK